MIFRGKQIMHKKNENGLLVGYPLLLRINLFVENAKLQGSFLLLCTLIITIKLVLGLDCKYKNATAIFIILIN